MRRFIRNLIFFILPIIAYLLIEGILPVTTFAFRSFEAIKFVTRIPRVGDFYPNINLTVNAVGDLCHHTDNEIVKLETLKTDRIGYRNDVFIEEADILFIGDSFIQGSGLSQEETISNKVSSKLGHSAKVYNMAPSSMSGFDKLIKCGVIKKPKLLIFSIVERDVPSEIIPYTLKKSWLKETIRPFFTANNLNVFIDKALRHYSIDWLKARINQSKGRGLPSVGNPKMFFLNGINNKHNDGDLISTANIIISYKKYCDFQGIDFMFLPMPDKETVYYELVPFQNQPKYLFELDSILVSSGVATINTLKIYNDYRKENNSLLYHYDDTHWNSNATELIATELINNLQTRKHY